MAVPWVQILKWVPAIVDVSRDLLKRSRQMPPQQSLVRATDRTDTASRVTALEENERRQAELVNRMAEQIAQLSSAVVMLHRQIRWLGGALAALLLVVVVLFSLTR